MVENNLNSEQKAAILRIVNNPQLTFAETKQELTNIQPNFSSQQIEALAKVICEEIDQSKRGKFSGVTDLEGKKFKVG